MPAFVPPQLCKSTSRSPSADGWLHEIKFDGYRIQMRVEDGDVSLKTRAGLGLLASSARHRHLQRASGCDSRRILFRAASHRLRANATWICKAEEGRSRAYRH